MNDNNFDSIASAFDQYSQQIAVLDFKTKVIQKFITLSHKEYLEAKNNPETPPDGLWYVWRSAATVIDLFAERPDISYLNNCSIENEQYEDIIIELANDAMNMIIMWAYEKSRLFIFNLYAELGKLDIHLWRDTDRRSISNLKETDNGPYYNIINELMKKGDIKPVLLRMHKCNECINETLSRDRYSINYYLRFLTIECMRHVITHRLGITNKSELRETLIKRHGKNKNGKPFLDNNEEYFIDCYLVQYSNDNTQIKPVFAHLIKNETYYLIPNKTIAIIRDLATYCRTLYKCWEKHFETN